MQFWFANCEVIRDAEIVIIGVPDYSGSHSKRSFDSSGPDIIRRVFNENSVIRRGNKDSLLHGQNAIFNKKVFDAGNIPRAKLTSFIEELRGDSQIPVIIGGDHSLTYEIMKGYAPSRKTSLSLVYLDAHPDSISSDRNYYGSVVSDVLDLKIIDPTKSVLAGIRAPEREEILNIKHFGINAIGINEIIEEGVQKTFHKIEKITKKDSVYLSVDLDVLDPAFAPAVSTPMPGGLSSAELIYLVSKIAGLGIVGFDIMEFAPKHDRDNLTADLAGRLILETISNI